MENVVNVVINAGRSALDVALYTLLPIMVIMTILMRFLETYGILGRMVVWLTPLVRPFGLSGLGALAILQGTFISFIAPLATLKMMEVRGTSDRVLAASLAAIFATASANATYPLISLGLSIGTTVATSIVGALLAAASTYWLWGRNLSKFETGCLEKSSGGQTRPSVIDIINVSGSQAVQSIVAVIPMLILSLAVVFGLQQLGFVDWLANVLTPWLSSAGIDSAYILPAITKYLAGGTAMVAVFHELAKHPGFDHTLISKGAGFLIHPFDLPGLGIFAAAGPRTARVLLPAAGGAIVGIAIRTIATGLIG
jgi:spore maturation protein SpmB